MSIGSHSAAESAVSSQIGAQPLAARPAPHKRRITAKRDATEQPEPR